MCSGGGDEQQQAAPTPEPAPTPPPVNALGARTLPAPPPPAVDGGSRTGGNGQGTPGTDDGRVRSGTRVNRTSSSGVALDDRPGGSSNSGLFM